MLYIGYITMTYQKVAHQTTYTFKCPSCRISVQLPSSPEIINSVDNDCIICCDNKANIIFPQCDHNNICFDCVKKLDHHHNKSNKRTLNHRDFPIIAFLSYVSYNQEDSLVFNKKSIQWGKFRDVSIKK